MMELKKTYQKINQQTKNKLQEIFDSINFDFNNLYSIADGKTKRRINTYIGDWQDKGLLKGQFGLLANNIKNRIRVKNSEILELLIYAVYMEEQEKLNKTELNIFKDVANYYYQEGQKEVKEKTNKKKTVSVIPDAIFLSLLDMPNSKGYVWNEYIEAIIKFNADQIYRQLIIDIQQGKDIQIDSDIYQNIIKKQQNNKLNINGDKISGDVDLTLIGINNKAKEEGIYSFDKNAKIRFIAVHDSKTTDMCKSLDGQEFYVHNWNEFYRYSKTNDGQVKYRCYGLIVGLNCPPINDGFHWCRSTIEYLPPIEKEEEKEYNIDIPKISDGIKPLLQNKELNKNVSRLFKKYLTDDNIKYDESRDIPAWYSEEDDCIHISQDETKWKNYEPIEVFTHEICHLIDKRNNVLQNNKNISSLIRSSELEISLNLEQYKEMFKNEDLYYDMSSGDVISILSNGKVETFFYHPIGYTNKEEDIIANIQTAYLTKNETALNFFSQNDTLNKLKNEIVGAYNEYTK